MLLLLFFVCEFFPGHQVGLSVHILHMHPGPHADNIGQSMSTCSVPSYSWHQLFAGVRSGTLQLQATSVTPILRKPCQGVQGSDSLHYLEQFIGVKPRDLVRSCQHINPQEAYSEARSLLFNHYSKEMRSATANMNQAFNWPRIKPDDGKALHSYSLFLSGCNKTSVTYKRLRTPLISELLCRSCHIKWEKCAEFLPLTFKKQVEGE